MLSFFNTQTLVGCWDKQMKGKPFQWFSPRQETAEAVEVFCSHGTGLKPGVSETAQPLNHLIVNRK
jgi:hypothetical protein